MTVPASFRNYCQAEWNEDDTVTVHCQLGNRIIEETIDIKPIAKQLAIAFARMNGETSVAGLGSFLSQAKKTAAKIAASKGIKSVWNAASPVLKAAASEVPGGSTAMAVAVKTYAVVDKARKGDPKAIASLKKAAIKAANGNPLAKEVMGTAQKLNNLLTVKEAKNPVDINQRLLKIEQTLNPLLDNPQSPYRTKGGTSVSGYFEILDKDEEYDLPDEEIGSFLSKAKWAVPGYAAYRGARAIANRGRHHPSPRKPARTAPRGGMPVRSPGGVAVTAPLIKPSQAMPGPRPLVPAEPELEPEMERRMEDMQEDLESQGYEEDEADNIVAGWREWLYTRPFRGPASAMLQGDYGLGLSLRSLYADGLERIKSMGKR